MDNLGELYGESLSSLWPLQQLLAFISLETATSSKLLNVKTGLVALAGAIVHSKFCELIVLHLL